VADQPISDADLDAITRTVLGEGSGDAAEQAGIAHVILNRRMLGAANGYADTIDGVVHQPNAFEAWSRKNAPNYPEKFSAKSPAYQQARQIVEGAASGMIPDPTGGYTHFLEPHKVAERVQAGKMKWPAWAPDGAGLTLGKQVFFPHEDSDAVANMKLERRIQKTAEARAVEDSDVAADKAIEERIRRREATTAPASSAATAAPAGSMPTAPQIVTGRTYETPEERAASVARGKEGQNTAGNLGRSAWETIKNIAGEGSETFGRGMRQVGQAPAEWARSQPLTALGDVGSGMLNMATAYPSALVHHGIQEPITQVTGNPDIGKRAGVVASLPIPFKGGTAVNAARPAVQGLKDLIQSIPADDLAAGIKRLENNPRLSPAAVFPEIHDQVVDIASRPGPWKDKLDRTQRDLAKETRTVGEEQIQPIIDAAKKPAEITPVLNLIDKEFGSDVVARRTLEAYKNGEKLSEFYPLSAYQKELLRWRDKLVGPREAGPGEPKFLDVGGEQGLHQIQSDMRVKNEKLREPGLNKIREAIKDQIESVAPGYRDSLSAYHDAADMRSLGEDLQTAGVKSEKTTNRGRSEPPEPRKPGSGMQTVASGLLGFGAEIGAHLTGLPTGGALGPIVFGASRTIPPLYRGVMSKVDMARWRMRNQAVAEHAIAPAGSAEGTLVLNLLRGRRDAPLALGGPQKKLSDLLASPIAQALPQ
jgi:hypothetical protein